MGFKLHFMVHSDPLHSIFSWTFSCGDAVSIFKTLGYNRNPKEAEKNMKRLEISKTLHASFESSLTTLCVLSHLTLRYSYLLDHKAGFLVLDHKRADRLYSLPYTGLLATHKVFS